MLYDIHVLLLLILKEKKKIFIKSFRFQKFLSENSCEQLQNLNASNARAVSW